MPKTIRKLIKENPGIKLTYRERSDGGILITSINGKKFKGAKGNNQFRQMVGEKLTIFQTEQRAKANTRSVNIRSGKTRRYNVSVPKEMARFLVKIQRAERKRRKEDSGFTGRTTIYRVRQSIEQEGEVLTWEYLQHKYEYVRDEVNRENKLALINRLNTLINSVKLNLKRINESTLFNKQAIVGDLNRILDNLYKLNNTFLDLLDKPVSNSTFSDLLELFYGVATRIERGNYGVNVVDDINACLRVIDNL